MTKVYAQDGDTLLTAINKVKQMMKPDEYCLALDYNGIEIAVYKDSNAIDLITIYNLRYNIQNNIFINN